MILDGKTKEKYYNKYQDIIKYSKFRVYSEEEKALLQPHRIRPLCVHGTDHPDNIVFISPKDHIMAHHILCRVFPNNEEIKHSYEMVVHQNKRNK
jgi:hypothetical protein